MFGPDVVLRRKIKRRLDVVVGSIDVLGQGVEVAEAPRRRSPGEGRDGPPREHVVAVARGGGFSSAVRWLRSED